MFFVDDGISGTSFERSDFQRMHRMVEEGKIGTIIVKDLSRFGREHISEELWLRVQELRQHRRRPTATGRTSLFSGLVFCPDCGAKLHFAAAKSMTRNQEHFRCSNYKSGCGECTVHYIRDVVLERIVLEAIRSSGHCYVKVDIYFTAVGMIDIPTEQEILAMMEEIRANPQEFRFVA